ncbi:MAG: hypothetical protein ABW004_15095 [Aeromicrobium sp.]|jgi:uncharacterized membrane protein YqjE
MTRHPLRWENLAFGLFFLAIVGNWAVWKRDILTPRELGLTAATLLIVLGVLGVALTLWQARPTRTTTTTRTTERDDHEGAQHEEADPQP